MSERQRHFKIQYTWNNLHLGSLHLATQVRSVDFNTSFGLSVGGLSWGKNLSLLIQIILGTWRSYKLEKKLYVLKVSPVLADMWYMQGNQYKKYMK